MRHEDLTSEEAAAAMAEVMEGRAAAAHIAGLLVGLAMKGERPTEIVGHAGPVRKDLGVRTAFNLLGPLTNPAGASRQIVGVPRPELTELIARSLQLLGSERAWVVHGADGIDEISTTGYTKVSECKSGSVNTFYLHPADVGLPKAAPDALKGGDAHENARIIERVLGGERGPARDVVLLNAGASLFIAGAAKSVDEGILKASRAIDRGDAKRTLETLVSISTAEEFAAGASA